MPKLAGGHADAQHALRTGERRAQEGEEGQEEEQGRKTTMSEFEN